MGAVQQGLSESAQFRGVKKLGGSKFGNFHFYEKQQHELDKIFEGEVVETPNLQDKCTLVWWMCHVSDDPVGSKLCPQGKIPFFNIMPSSSHTLWQNFTKFGTGVQCNRGFKIQKFRGVQNLGGSKFWIFRIFYFHHFWANYAKINKLGVQKFL